MIRSTLSYAVIFLFITGTAVAQITINLSDYQNLIGNSYDINEYQTSSGSDLTTLVSLKGANQTFDFTTISSAKTQMKISYLKLPADIPGASDTAFANANGVFVSGFATWQYEQIKSDGVYSAGMAYVTSVDMNGDGQVPDTVIESYYPYKIDFRLPLTYQTAWKDTTELTETVGSYTVNQTFQTDAVVDGYGTLKLPNASESCLRIKVTETIITNLPYQQSKETIGYISYITKSGDTSALINLDQNGNPKSAVYLEPGIATPIENSPSAIASGYHLNQNYPNPFNPSTVISYDLKTAGQVKLDIYNALGQLVANLVNSTESAGTHNVTFNASQLNSGLYFYKLQAGNFSQTRKMMLIK